MVISLGGCMAPLVFRDSVLRCWVKHGMLVSFTPAALCLVMQRRNLLPTVHNVIFEPSKLTNNGISVSNQRCWLARVQ